MYTESVLPEEQTVSEILWRIGDQAVPYRELPERKFPDRDSIKTRISQPPDTGTPTLLQRPVDRPTLFLRLYPRDGADGVAISGMLCR
ncbi:hypothetical protein OUZ56_004978 [Daphnia magna]|uniref:Uncharacterized protein n=1 Tax=Daphnia magna TaxID=35525 RepID=A0ABQ9YRF3_9CRUS|nr:hypothetical protein OUZ56_004978 [Daphnia magna]